MISFNEKYFYYVVTSKLETTIPFVFFEREFIIISVHFHQRIVQISSSNPKQVFQRTRTVGFLH